MFTSIHPFPLYVRNKMPNDIDEENLKGNRLDRNRGAFTVCHTYSAKFHIGIHLISLAKAKNNETAQNKIRACMATKSIHIWLIDVWQLCVFVYMFVFRRFFFLVLVYSTEKCVQFIDWFHFMNCIFAHFSRSDSHIRTISQYTFASLSIHFDWNWFFLRFEFHFFFSISIDHLFRDQHFV